LLTIDDGLSNFYKTVVPILTKEKITAINFLNTNFIDNKNIFFRYKVNILINRLLKGGLTARHKKELTAITSKPIVNYLKKATQKEEVYINKIAKILSVSFDDFLENKKPYLSKQQIINLIEKGFYFGAHSKSHPYYHTINLEQQLKETLESVNHIKKEFNLEYKFFAFPFSDYGVSQSFFNSLQKENIISYGSAGLKDDDTLNHFQRIPMEYKSKYSAETIIKGELLYCILKRFIRKNKIVRK
jgi:peptidoglycan/xylan/chitin deacetylase (PgdA/CDA1 family)